MSVIFQAFYHVHEFQAYTLHSDYYLSSSAMNALFLLNLKLILSLICPLKCNF